jgi:hypothetical protein
VCAAIANAVRYASAMRYVDDTDEMREVREELEREEGLLRQARLDVAKHSVQIDVLKTRLRGLERRQRTALPLSRNRTLTPRKQAGRYVRVAHATMKKHRRPMTQKEVGELGGIGTGTLTHAMQALVAEGIAELTGEKRGRSYVYRLTEKGNEPLVAAKVTRAKPGSAAAAGH